jgi:hypothetical protein
MQPHLKDQLVQLRLCLKALPTDIPIPEQSKYNFSEFSPDADWTAEIGEVGAVSFSLRYVSSKGFQKDFLLFL